MTRQMTIIELEAEFLAEIRALGMLSYARFSGTLRGDRVVRGPHVGITFPAEMRITACLRKKLRRLVKKYFGPCKRPVVNEGRFCRYEGDKKVWHRHMAIEFEKGVES